MTLMKIDSDPNPLESALAYTTGTLALIFIMLTLAVTPIRKLTGWNWLSHFRRMIGLFAFCYALVHVSIYFNYDQALSVSGVVADTIKRPFILYGMAGLLFFMTPLALTSTNGMIKRLGARRWKWLHRLIYVAAVCGVVHYWKLVKADTRKPAVFTMVLAVLLGYRLIVAALGRRRAGQTS